MEKEKKEKKKSWVLVTILIVCLFVVATMGGYFIGATKFSTKLIENHKKVAELEKTEVEQEVADEKTTVEVKDPYRSCTGTYKGNCVMSVDVQTGATTTGDCTITLKEDGTFDFKKSDLNAADYSGNFVIQKNTLILIHSKHTVGPEDEDPFMNADTHLITNDCSTIKMKSDLNDTTVELKK